MSEIQNMGRTALFISIDENILGLIALADTIKEGSVEAVNTMHDLNLHVVLLTGDNQQTAQKIGSEINSDQIFAEVLPDQKVEVIRKLQRERSGGLAMVGDGINDAPALVQADVGFAIGTGTDVAMEAADVTLIGGDVRAVPRAIGLSRATMRTIKQNLFWAFFYNLLLIPIAAGVLYPFTSFPIFLRELHPILAALAMAFSSVTVVFNSLRLKLATRA